MRKRLNNSKDVAKFREELLKQQNGKDPITGEEIVNPVLDHYHYDEQYCRAVLENTTNQFEGKVQSAFKRFIESSSSISLPEILRNLADYLEADYSEMPIHSTALSVDVRKFKSFTAETQCRLLIEHGIKPESNSEKRSKQARKLIKSGVLNISKMKRGE